jgi:hypothetical protein
MGERERERDLPEAGRGHFMRWSLDGPPNGRESSRLGRRRSIALVCPNLVSASSSSSSSSSSTSSSSSSSSSAAGGLEEGQWPDKVFDMSSRVDLSADEHFGFFQSFGTATVTQSQTKSQRFLTFPHKTFQRGRRYAVNIRLSATPKPCAIIVV